MPWVILQRDGKWCVVRKDDGETKKCYDRRNEALQYLRALYSNTDEDERKED